MDNSILVEQVTFFSPHVFDVIRNLAQQEGENYKPLTDDDAKGMLTSSHIYLYIARDTLSDTVVGMGTLIIHRIPYVKKALMEDVVVDHMYRGRGIGTMIIGVLTERAKELGASYIDFTARPRREDSNSLYGKLGFNRRETNVYRKIFDYDEI